MHFNSVQSVLEFLDLTPCVPILLVHFGTRCPVFGVNVIHLNIKLTSMYRSNKDMLHCP